MIAIEICPAEPRADIVTASSDTLADLEACRAAGDCEPACEYVLDTHEPSFSIVARNAAGEYENRQATSDEMAETCRAIYFDSDADFTNERTAKVYLIWQAAHDLEGN